MKKLIWTLAIINLILYTLLGLGFAMLTKIHVRVRPNGVVCSQAFIGDQAKFDRDCEEAVRRLR